MREKISMVDVLYFLGAVLVSAGVGLLSLPCGLIAAGGFALAASVLTERASSHGDGDGRGADERNSGAPEQTGEKGGDGAA